MHPETVSRCTVKKSSINGLIPLVFFEKKAGIKNMLENG